MLYSLEYVELGLRRRSLLRGQRKQKQKTMKDCLKSHSKLLPELQIAPRTTNPTLHVLCRVTLGCKGAAQGPGGEGKGMSVSSHECKMIKRQE